MKTYKLGTEAFKRPKWVLIILITIVGIGGVILGTYSTIRQDIEFYDWTAPNVFGQFLGDHLGGLVGIVLLVLFLIFVARRAIDQQLAVLKSIEVELGEDYVARQQLRIPKLVVKRDEITKIEDMGSTLCIRTANKNRSLAIPKTLDGYEEIQSVLLNWNIPIRPVALRTKWLNVASGVGAVVGLVVLLFVWNFWIVLVAWLGLMILYGYLYWVLRRSEGVDPRNRRNYVFLLGWIVFIGAIKFCAFFMMMPVPAR